MSRICSFVSNSSVLSSGLGCHSPPKPALFGVEGSRMHSVMGTKVCREICSVGEKAFFLNGTPWIYGVCAVLTYTVSYSRVLFSFRNEMCKIHSHFPPLVRFSFSSLVSQCFLFLGAALLVVDGSSLLLRIAPVFSNTIDSAFWSISVCWSFIFCPTQ